MQGLTRAALSSDGKLLAVVLPSNFVQLWDVETGKPLHQIKSPTTGVSAMAFAPGGKTLAIRGASDRICHLHETETGKELRKLKPVPPGGKGGNISGGSDNGTGLAFSPDGKVIALPELEFNNNVVSGSVTLFEVETGKEIRRIVPPTHGIAAIAFSPDGKTLVFNTLSAIHVKDAETGKEIRQIKNFVGGTNLIVFAPDGQTLAVKGRDQSVRLFDPKTGNLLRTLSDMGAKGRNVINWNRGPTTDMVYSADSKTIVIGGQQVPRFFDVATGKEQTLVGGGHGGAVSALLVRPDGKTIVSRGAEGMLRSWDPVSGEEVHRFTEPTGTSAIQFSPDGKRVALGNNDGTVRLLHLADGKQERQWNAHQGTIANIAFSSDGRKLATRGAYDGSLRVFDALKGTELKHIVFLDLKPQGGAAMFVRTSGQADVHPLTFSPDGKTLAIFIASQQVLVQGRYEVLPGTNCVRLFDVDTGKEMRKISMPSGCTVHHLVYSPDGRLLISENMDKTVSLWEVASGQERSRFGDPVTALPQANTTSFIAINALARTGPALVPSGITIATSRDAGLIAAPGPNHSIRVFDVSVGKQVGSFRGHDGAIASLVFAEDGKRLVSGGSDTTILVWDLASLKRQPTGQISKFQPNEFDGLWADLASTDGHRAGKAVHKLIAGSQGSVTLLKEHIQPAIPADPKAIDQWLRDLDSSSYIKRELATRELVKLDELAVPALQKLQATRPAVETRRRIEFLLDALTGRHLSPTQIRVVRTIEVLEKVGTVEAKQVLERLADGAAGSLTTRQAQMSLDRLRLLDKREP
jgi:WD40 repeat protein